MALCLRNGYDFSNTDTEFYNTNNNVGYGSYQQTNNVVDKARQGLQNIFEDIRKGVKNISNNQQNNVGTASLDRPVQVVNIDANGKESIASLPILAQLKAYNGITNGEKPKQVIKEVVQDANLRNKVEEKVEKKEAQIEKEINKEDLKDNKVHDKLKADWYSGNLPRDRKNYLKQKEETDYKRYCSMRKFLNWHYAEDNIRDKDFQCYYAWKEQPNNLWSKMNVKAKLADDKNPRVGNYLYNDFAVWKNFNNVEHADAFDDYYAMQKFEEWENEKNDYKKSNPTLAPPQYGCNDYFLDKSYRGDRQNCSLKNFCKFRRYCDWNDFSKVTGANQADMTKFQAWKAQHNKNYIPEKYHQEWIQWKNDKVPIDPALTPSQVANTAHQVVENAKVNGQPISSAAPVMTDQFKQRVIEIQSASSNKNKINNKETSVVPIAEAYCGFDYYKKWNDWKQWKQYRGANQSLSLSYTNSSCNSCSSVKSCKTCTSIGSCTSCPTATSCETCSTSCSNSCTDSGTNSCSSSSGKCSLYSESSKSSCPRSCSLESTDSDCCSSDSDTVSCSSDTSSYGCSDSSSSNGVCSLQCQSDSSSSRDCNSYCGKHSRSGYGNKKCSLYDSDSNSNFSSCSNDDDESSCHSRFDPSFSQNLSFPSEFDSTETKEEPRYRRYKKY